ncbi:helix-turn-helix domain-containing protein [bacterium]|nr:helix-turn-helix domain-containing protein [bacterium]MBQ4437377.1 helix-turn-helix domain-containing protein [bacterium]
MVKLIAAFSPKGGAGTSMIIANLSIYLAQKGKKVLLIDAAPNGGTLHSYLNLPTIAVSDEVAEHFSVLPLISTDYQNLSFFSNLQHQGSKISELLTRWQGEMGQVQFDFVFIDMGSVINHDLMDVIGIADYSLMFLSPDFISFEKSNYFFRELFNYRLRNVELKYDIQLETQNIRRAKNDYLFTSRNLLVLLSQAIPKTASQIANIVNDLKIGIVYNGVRNSADKELVQPYRFLISNSFGIETDSIAEIAYSDLVPTSVATMKPVVTLEKNAEFVDALDKFASTLSANLFQQSSIKKKLKVTPFNYYEWFGLDRGCSTFDINNQYEKLKKLYVGENPMMRDVYSDSDLFILNSLIDTIFKELNDSEIRREYDMDISSHLLSLETSFPDIFMIGEVIKKYNRVKKREVLVKKDVFGRSAEKKVVASSSSDFVDANEIFNKYRDLPVTGDLLRKIREEVGISYELIISRTKISKMVLDAIENDKYAQLPADLYVKNFVQQYCKTLKMNASNTELIASGYLKSKNVPSAEVAENVENNQEKR